MYLCADPLRAEGFEQCKNYPFVFRKIVDGAVDMIVGVDVDDPVAEGSEKDCDDLLGSLDMKVPTQYSGEYTWYARCGIERDVEHCRSALGWRFVMRVNVRHACRRH